jgi:hypothetical protein
LKIEGPTPQTVTRPMPIDLAVMGSSAVESARLRERHVLPFVVDAMVLIEDALHRVAEYRPTVRGPDNKVMPWPKPSALSHLMALHAVRVYGKADLLQEVVERLPAVAARKGRDPEPALRLIRDEYAPQIRLVDPLSTAALLNDDRFDQVAAVDPDDLPTAQLCRLLDPSILLTRDKKSLLRFGFGEWLDDDEMDVFVSLSNDDWLKASLRVRARAFDSQMQAGGQAMVGGGRLAAAAGGKVLRVARDNPIPMVIVLVAAAVAIWITRDSPFWPELRSNVSKTTSAAASEFDKRTSGRPAAALAARSRIDSYLAIHASPGVPVATVARILSIAPPDGLSVAELRHITAQRFAIRPIVEGHPAFVVDENGRWHLGERARMPDPVV